jgi:hypothetical protein
MSKSAAKGPEPQLPQSQSQETNEPPLNIKLSSNPTIRAEIPAGPISQEQIITLLNRAVAQASILHQEEINQIEKSAFEKGYRKGVKAAKMICDSPLCETANRGVVQSQPDCSKFVVDTLSRMSGDVVEKPPPPRLWEKPHFLGAGNYIRQNKPDQRRRLMGYIDGKEIVVVLVGYVETHIVEDDDPGGFQHECEIYFPAEGEIKTGFCLGYIRGTGTAVIIDQDDKLYVYTPKDAIDPPWDKLVSEGAELLSDSDHNLLLRDLPGMVAESVEV